MTQEDVIRMIEEMGMPYAYDHFVEGESPDPPFLVFLYPRSDNFAADGKVYYKINQLNIELYSDLKDVSLEAKIEAVLDKHGFYYEKTETWIDSEKLYEILYQFEMEGMNYGEEK